MVILIIHVLDSDQVYSPQFGDRFRILWPAPIFEVSKLGMLGAVVVVTLATLCVASDSSSKNYQTSFMNRTSGLYTTVRQTFT